MKTYEAPKVTKFGTVAELTRQPAAENPPGKLDTGEDAFGQRSRIESSDGPAWTEFK